MKIILASGSPRRKEILERAGISCEIIVSNADETISGEPDYQVKELALRKARAVAERFSADDAIILAADTLVFVNGRILEKPRDAAEAFSMIKTLQGRHHVVYTGVALIRHGADSEFAFTDAARVFFRALSDVEINAYIATGEPFDKAGGYGVQGRGAVLVERIEGDFYTVMGLPISKVCVALAEMGYDIWQ